MESSLRSVKFIPGKRAGIKEDPLKEGIIEVRPGTKGIDLGENKYYAMAYIRVLDDRHCFKGMCVYSDNLPDDYDIICYFRDPKHGLTVLRTVTPEMNLSKDIVTIIRHDGMWNQYSCSLKELLNEQTNKRSHETDSIDETAGREQCEKS